MIFYDKKEGVLSDYSRGRIWNIMDYYMHYKYAKGYQDTDPDFNIMTKQLPVASGHPMSYSEFRMEGARVELEKMVSNISIASDNKVEPDICRTQSIREKIRRACSQPDLYRK